MLTATGNYIINVYIYLHQILLHKMWMNVQQTMAMVHVIRLASIHLDHTNVAVLLVMLWLPMGGHVLVSEAWNKVTMKFYCLTFVDVNECSLNAGLGYCQQKCTNTAGSYNCSCNTGYTQFGYYCNGMNITK